MHLLQCRYVFFLEANARSAFRTSSGFTFNNRRVRASNPLASDGCQHLAEPATVNVLALVEAESLFDRIGVQVGGLHADARIAAAIRP